MDRYRRHRYALALPFLVLALAAVIGGVLNGVTVNGRLVDDYSEDPVKDGKISVGRRATWSGEDGSFTMENVPRTTSLRVEAGGYLIASPPPQSGEIRLAPLSVTVQVNIEATSPAEGVPSAQLRQEGRTLATANATGGAVVSPHPGKDAKVLVCAQGFASREVTVRGVTLVVTLRRDPSGDCPPLPTPSPSPTVSPSPGASPASSPSPGASPSPSPR